MTHPSNIEFKVAIHGDPKDGLGHRLLGHAVMSMNLNDYCVYHGNNMHSRWKLEDGRIVLSSNWTRPHPPLANVEEAANEAYSAYLAAIVVGAPGEA